MEASVALAGLSEWMRGSRTGERDIWRCPKWVGRGQHFNSSLDCSDDSSRACFKMDNWPASSDGGGEHTSKL